MRRNDPRAKYQMLNWTGMFIIGLLSACQSQLQHKHKRLACQVLVVVI
jgi:hypothetical protein